MIKFILSKDCYVFLGIGKDEIELAIAAPPRDGQANERLVKAIMDFLDLRKNEISFEMVQHNRKHDI